MKKIGTILLFIIPAGFIIGLAIWGYSIWKNLTFKPYFVSADFKGLSAADIPSILAGGERNINAVIGIEIKNDSSTSVSFNGLKAKLYYNEVLIAETGDDLSNQKFTAKAKNSDNPLYIQVPVVLKLNKGVSQLLLDKLSGIKPKIDYSIQLTIWGIPLLKWFPITSSFEW